MVIDFVTFAENVIDGNYENASLVKSGDGGFIFGGLRAAWALSHWSGIVAYGQVGHYNLDEFAASDNTWRFGGAASLDFGQRGNAPVGFTLAFDVDRLTPQAFASETAFAIGAGVHFTGRNDLNLGLETQIVRLRLRKWEETAYPISLGMVLNYYF